MGKFQGFITGLASGKVGGLVFAKVRGIDTVRAYQGEVNFRNTPGQQLTLQRNRVIMLWARTLLALEAIGFRTRPSNQTAFSQFLKLNNPSALTGSTVETVAVLFPAMKVAQGSMGVTPISTVVVDEGDATATVTWNNSLTPLGSAPSDQANVAFINPTTGDAVVAPLAALRSAGTLTQPIPAGWEEGQTVHCYLFFSSTVTNQVSDSVHEPSAIVA